VAVCLDRVQEEVGDALRVEWRSYLLRPEPRVTTPEKFRDYTRSWARPAAQPDAGTFREWASDEPPPSHSVPSAVATKAAARQGPEAFERFHRALMHAYFARNLDVSSRATILLVAAECGLDDARMQRDLDDPALVEAVLADHREAMELGITAVPSVVLEGGFQLPGAQESAVYLRVVERLRAQQESSRHQPTRQQPPRKESP
jgi:predicted DsbA family dithiol-disulfide isomerase